MPKPKKTAQRVDNSQCKKCLYKIVETQSAVFCGYMYYTGKRRPCDPSPNCTAFEKFTKRGRKELEEKFHKKLGVL